jgi:nucleoside-diphosphate-sugar epimerase
VKRVLLTGARGFLGSNCLAPLLARGYEVHAVSRSLEPGVARAMGEPREMDGAREAGQPQEAAETPESVVWHQADLLDGQQVTALLDAVRPTHLLHLAWVVTPGAFWTSPLNWPWVDASLKLLAAFGAVGGQRAVMVGSCAEYAPSDAPCVEAQTPLAPTTVYSACKAALGVMLPTFAQQYGVPSAAWARVFYLYGPGEQPERLVPSVIRALLRNEAMPCSHGEQVRDFLYSEDAADALVALLDSPVTGAVNVASGRPIALRAFLSTIGTLTGREHLLHFGARPTRPDEPAALIADVSRLAHEVGWAPRMSLEDGMARMIAWWRREEERREAGQHGVDLPGGDL